MSTHERLNKALETVGEGLILAKGQKFIKEMTGDIFGTHLRITAGIAVTQDEISSNSAEEVEGVVKQRLLNALYCMKGLVDEDIKKLEPGSVSRG